MTDGNGALTFPCPPSHPRVSGRAELASAFVSIIDGSGHPASLAFDLPAADGDLEFSVAAGRAYNAINYGGPIAALRFGVTRSPVGVQLDAPGLPALGARYAPDHDRIEATSAAIDSYPFEEAFFKVLHEYGHAFHYVAIEPWGSYTCRNGTHAFETENSLSCAFVEGFAHFFAAWIGGSRLDSDEALPNAASDRVLEENLYRGRLSDGARTPGVVAALLYDLADGADSPDGPGNTANGDDDPISVGGADLVSVIRGCRLVPPSGCPVVDRLDGADQLIACAEGDPAASAAGRRWRSYQAVESSSAPIGGDRAALRSLWLRDLYGEN